MTREEYIMLRLQQQREEDEKRNKKGIVDTTIDYASDLYEGLGRTKAMASSLANIIAGTGQYNIHNIISY